MTENITGTVVAATVTGTLAAIFTGTPPTRDALLVTNNTPGTVVFLNDVNAASRQFPVRAGETREIPFRSGQIYAFAAATTAENVDEAEIEVRPITVDSAFARETSTLLAGLAQNVASAVPCTCGADDPVLAIEAIRGTDLTGTNAPVVNIAQFDITGRTLEVRNSTGTVLEGITATAIAGEQLVRVEFENISRTTVSFSVVAVLEGDETDVLGLFRGTVKGV